MELQLDVMTQDEQEDLCGAASDAWQRMAQDMKRLRLGYTLNHVARI